MNKIAYKYLLALSLLLVCQFLSAQTRFWITGSAVPGGTQELEKFAIQGSSSSCFKFHGTLLPGDLYIVTTETPSASRYYYKPKLVDSNIVNDGIAWTKTRTEEGSAWAVLFEASNYRFTFNPATGGTVKGELFPWWYESLLVGGCVADKQGESKGNHSWQLESGVQMTQNLDNPYEWTFAGYLYNYTYNDEPKRLKILGQMGWGPKALLAMKQGAPLLSATQASYGGSDYKWEIGDDGFYFIRTNVFEETIHAEYYKTKEDWVAIEDVEDDNTPAHISVAGKTILVSSAEMVTAQMIAPDGVCYAMRTGTQISMTAPKAGTYIIVAEGKDKKTVKKIIID